MEKDRDKKAPDSVPAINGSFPEKRSLKLANSFKNAVVQTATQPILSLKNVQVTKESGRKLLAFAVKVAALEIIRRHTHGRYPSIWGCIQSLPLLQIPPFSWILHWGPLKYLLFGTQAFSKPIMFLSLATTISEKWDELRSIEEPTAWREERSSDEASDEGSEAVGPLALVTATNHRVQNNSQALVYSSDKLAVLKKELEQLRVPLSDRIADDELNRFLLAANNDVKTCVKLVQRNMRWRETFYFFPQYELEKWSALVFWHGYDAHKRPSLIVRIGLAYSILDPHERPRFAQAILSQVEYGITHLLHEEDPRITVIIDCEGTPALGFPINMLKSCSDRVQDNYPTRLAALFVVNLPPVVRLLTQTIIQVLKPNTKRKIFVEGEQYNALAEHYGDVTAVPRFLGGACTCSYCTKKMTGDRVRLQLLDKQASNEDEDADDPYVNETPMQEFTSCSRFNFIIRAIIIGFLTLWVVISFLAIFFDPEIDFIPT